ncbi:hypothetical protein Tco_0987022 [Tanacetum coccineum]
MNNQPFFIVEKRYLAADSELPCTHTYLRLTISPNVWSLNSLGLVPSCFAIFDFELLSLSLVPRSLNLFLVCLYRLFHAILCLDQHAHTLHHLERFPTQSVRSSNADALDSPYLLVLITGMSQSRQHESRKSPTAELFEVDSRRIFIRHCGMLKSIPLNVLGESQG